MNKLDERVLHLLTQIDESKTQFCDISSIGENGINYIKENKLLTHVTDTLVISELPESTKELLKYLKRKETLNQLFNGI